MVGFPCRDQGEHLELPIGQRVRWRPVHCDSLSVRALQRLDPARVGLRSETLERLVGERDFSICGIIIVERA